MSRADKIKFIVAHCSAGFSLIPRIENFWYNTRGWKNPGYAMIVYESGEVWYVTEDGSYSTDRSKSCFDKITNGVKGFNSNSIHICYIGGVEKDNVKLAKDTRTQAQKESIQNCILEVLSWLDANGVDAVEKLNTGKLTVLGHRDFSKDKNGNGVIESWERIKVCPSYDAGQEYEPWLQTIAPDYKFQLP